MTSLRTDASWLGIVPSDQASPSGSATATVIVSARTSSPTNRIFFTTGSFPLYGSALLVFTNSQRNPRQRIGAGRSILTSLFLADMMSPLAAW